MAPTLKIRAYAWQHHHTNYGKYIFFSMIERSMKNKKHQSILLSNPTSNLTLKQKSSPDKNISFQLGNFIIIIIIILKEFK